MKPNRILLISYLLSHISFLTLAQIGGDGIYKFLNLSPSARVTAMGGSLISVKDQDINNAYQNPALLNRKMDNAIAFNRVNYLADVSYGYFAYGKHLKKMGTVDAGLYYVNYGKFREADASGNVTGDFKAGDYAFVLGWAMPYDEKVSYGVNLKTIYSSLAEYTSVGLAADAGIAYHDSASSFTATIVAKNMGQQITSYREDNFEELPFEIQAGISKKLDKAPFRYSIIAHNLQQFDLTYIDPKEQAREIDLATGEPVKKEFSFAEKLSRHFIIGAEALISKNFNLRVAYNHQRRKELAIAERGSTVGFSWGFGLRIKKINFSYGSAGYHLADASNHFSISVNLNDFVKK